MLCSKPSKKIETPYIILSFLFWVNGASADPISATLPPSYFGKQKNFCISGSKGVCAAAAAINSFIFLGNQYPDILGNNLTPSSTGPKGDEEDQRDTESFAIQYYFGLFNNQNRDPLDFYSEIKSEWFKSHTPNINIEIDSWYIGSPHKNRPPTSQDLFEEIQHKEDVEIFVYNVDTIITTDKTYSPGEFAHALNLTGVSCTESDFSNCSITYQDNNTPGINQPAYLTSTDSGITFKNLPLSGVTNDTTFKIYAAFSESVVPEPSSLSILGVGFSLLSGFHWQRTNRRRSSSRVTIVNCVSQQN
jgi:hypothetical protein